MQALILAAGRGSRLGHLTDHQPKCLVEVAGQPILMHQLRLLKALGVEDIVVVTGYLREQVHETARTVAGVRTVHNPFWSLTNVIGSAWFGFREVDETVLYLHGDTLVTPPIVERVMRGSGEMVLPFDAQRCADEEMKVRLVGGRLVEISKTMDPDDAAGEFLGLCMIRASLLGRVRQAVDAELKEERYQGFFEAAIQRMIDSGQRSFELLDISGQFWREVDTPEDLAAAREYFKKSGGA